jgi:hypothetical protein
MLLDLRDGDFPPVENAGRQDGIRLRHAQDFGKVLHFACATGSNNRDGNGALDVLNQLYGGQG